MGRGQGAIATSGDRAEVRGQAASPALHNLTLQKHDSGDGGGSGACVRACVCVRVSVFVCVCACVCVFTGAIGASEQINPSMFCREIVYLQEGVDGCENVGEKYVLAQCSVCVCVHGRKTPDTTVKRVTI